MNLQLLFTTIENLVHLTGDQKEFLSGVLRQRKVKKGQFLLYEGVVQRYVYFVAQGLLASYYTAMDGREHIVQFAIESWWMSDMNSFTKQMPAMFNVKALEDSTVLELPFEHMQVVFERIPQMERYFRIITERGLITFQQRIVQNNSMSAKDRYVLFQQRFPNLQLRVPQKFIASYLGISPEFLSKIKKELH